MRSVAFSSDGRLIATAGEDSVGKHAHDAARNARVRQDLDLILLVGTIAPVDTGRRRQPVAEARGAHGRKL